MRGTASVPTGTPIEAPRTPWISSDHYHEMYS
jgi:hypothetical protein